MSEKLWNAPIHPAEFFRENFLELLEMSGEKAAEALDLLPEQMLAFLEERAPLTADLALRLSQAFGCSVDYWMRWQNDYDLRIARDRGVPDLPRVPGLIAAE